jgi:hypothetical protein
MSIPNIIARPSTPASPFVASSETSYTTTSGRRTRTSAFPTAKITTALSTTIIYLEPFYTWDFLPTFLLMSKPTLGEAIEQPRVR